MDSLIGFTPNLRRVFRTIGTRVAPLWIVATGNLLVAPPATARTVEFETSSVTCAATDVSPDGSWVCFTLVGHLFRVPIEGGEAEQLTFGSALHADPVISPDGAHVAFVSDRNGSDGSLHLLELATGAIRRLSEESPVSHPAWSPDGQTLTYILEQRDEASHSWQLTGALPMPGIVKRVAIDGGVATTLVAEPAVFRALFYLPDDRLAWSVAEQDPAVGGWVTSIEAMAPDGQRSTLVELDGHVGRVIPGFDDQEFFARRFRASSSPHPTRGKEDFIRVSLGEEAAPTVIMASEGSTAALGFGLSRTDKRLVLGHAGRLWNLDPATGARSPIRFHARVRREIADIPVPRPRRPTAGDFLAKSASGATLVPVSHSLVFAAAGFLFMQSEYDDTAHRLFEGNGYESYPAPAPDGKSLAFVRSLEGQSEVVVFEFSSGREHVVASGARYWWAPSWSQDSEELLITEYTGGSPSVVAANVSTGETRIVVSDAGWLQRPHFSGDGAAVYYTAKQDGRWTVFRQSMSEGAAPEPITNFEEDISEAVVSADGKHLVLRRGPGLYLVELGEELATEADVRPLTSLTVDAFGMTPNGIVVYSSAGQAWLHPLSGDTSPRAVDLKPRLERQVPPPLLLLRARILDLETGSFTPETTLYIERGRIASVAADQQSEAAQDIRVLDAEGRYVIPGLFDFHAHAAWAGASSHPVFIAYGVTSVREPGGPLGEAVAFSERAAATDEPIPRYFPSGAALQGSGTGGDARIAEPEEARNFVVARAEGGAYFVKVYASLPPSLQAYVARESFSLGLPVAAHGVNVSEIVRGVTLGFSVLEHCLVHGEIHDDLIQLLAVSGTRWDPTLVMRGGAVLLARDEPARLQDEKALRLLPQWGREAPFTSSLMRAEADQSLRGEWAARSRSIRRAHEAGVRLHAGTDDHGAQWLGLPGLSLHWELELMARAGVPADEILRMATLKAAEALGVDAELGSIEPGKLADLVILDADPLEDIRNSQRIWRVVKGGHLFDPDALGE